MGTAQLLFAGEQWGATGSDVSHVTGIGRSEVRYTHAQPEVAQYPP